MAKGALREIKSVTVRTIATEGEKRDPDGDYGGTDFVDFGRTGGASPSSTSASRRTASWSWVFSDVEFTAEPQRDAPEVLHPQVRDAMPLYRLRKLAVGARSGHLKKQSWVDSVLFLPHTLGTGKPAGQSRYLAWRSRLSTGLSRSSSTAEGQLSPEARQLCPGSVDSQIRLRPRACHHE